LLLDPLILVGSILYLIVVYYLVRFGILAEIVGLLIIRINRQIKREQEKTIKEIEEVKKFQVNQTLMGARRTTKEKFEERMHETRNEIIEMRKQIREWTRNASSREGYCCWAHQQANPNLVEIPPHKIPDFLHSNVANKKDPYFGALKSDL
ncbi:hypothetical protein PIB30_049185, partial [Stylosanthes scabra]|nr:hypothetical protein [Stylosanthes scabra]